MSDQHLLSVDVSEKGSLIEASLVRAVANIYIALSGSSSLSAGLNSYGMDFFTQSLLVSYPIQLISSNATTVHLNH